MHKPIMRFFRIRSLHMRPGNSDYIAKCNKLTSVSFPPNPAKENIHKESKKTKIRSISSENVLYSVYNSQEKGSKSGTDFKKEKRTDNSDASVH